MKTLALPEGYLLCWPVGSGHFVKMVHNGIEYGMLQAYGEGDGSFTAKVIAALRTEFGGHAVKTNE